MFEENTFNTEEDLKIGEILKTAFSIKDKEERAIFIENECGENLIMFEYVMECLDEMDFGENGFTNSMLESGNEVGNYIIIELINEGGIASVYSAEHKVLKTLAAIKVFDKLDVENIENDLFWNTDHSSLSRFNHDNIVKLYDVGSYEKAGSRLPYIAVEYVKGKHLDDHCKSKPLSIREVLKLFQDLCEVIEFIHDKEKILHLDLKPKNILVTADRPHRIKLIDFGSSKLFRSEAKQFTRSDLLNPLTLKFAPPEQHDQNEVLTNQSDIYSLGVILYLLITEKVPLGEGEKDKEKITHAVTNTNLLPVLPSKRVFELEDKTKFGVSQKELNEILSGDLDCIIMKALEKRRRNRYSSVSELRQDIDNFLRGKPVKARRKTFGYIITKSISQFFGFKGGLAGWDKWKTPLKRLSVFGSILVLLGFIGIIFQAPLYPRIAKTTVKSISQSLVSDEIGRIANKDVSYIYIYCGPKAEKEICFTFLPIPEGSFSMGFNDNEKKGLLTPVSGNVENKSTEIKDEKNQLTKNPLIKIGKASSEPDTEIFSATDDENFAKPQHPVTINKKIYMGTFEITNKQWNIVAKIPKVNIDLEVTDNDSSLPKTNISYSKAMEFCKRLQADLESQGKNVQIRLPYEAEWEYACRAGSEKNILGGGSKYLSKFVNAIIPCSNETPLCVEDLREKNSLPESSLYANPFGLVAMNGNVWEMVSDDWHDNYDDAPENNKKSWEDNTTENKQYVLRGGAYNTEVYMTQCFYRKSENFYSPGNDQTGFRIVMEAEGLD